MKFINYMCDDKVAGKVIEEFPYLNVNQKAVEQTRITARMRQRTFHPMYLRKVSLYPNLDTDTLKVYNDMWTN